MDLLKAVAEKLNRLYPNATIYTDDVMQNFKAPAFFIKIVEEGYRKLLFSRWEGTAQVQVIYYPVEDTYEKNGEMDDVNQNLLRNLNEIEMNGNLYRVINRSGQAGENGLDFRFQIKYQEEKTESEPIVKMLKGVIMSGRNFSNTK